jgi:hypothetical protein
VPRQNWQNVEKVAIGSIQEKNIRELLEGSTATSTHNNVNLEDEASPRRLWLS